MLSKGLVSTPSPEFPMLGKYTFDILTIRKKQSTLEHFKGQQPSLERFFGSYHSDTVTDPVDLSDFNGVY